MSTTEIEKVTKTTKTGKMRDGILRRNRTWSYVVRERDPKTGKTKQRWVGGFPTQKAAKKARDKARNDTHRGTYVAPQDITVGAYLDRWIEAHAVQLKPSTAASYRANIDRYLRPALGQERIQSLSPSRLSILFKDLYEKGGRDGKPLSPRTVEFARAVLRRAMRDAVLDRAIETNPVLGTKVRRVAKPAHTTWTGTQLRTFHDGLEDTDRWGPMWTLTAATGMRRGELMALRWADVDLDAGVVHVERSVTQVGQERLYVTPKNHERRDVAVDPRTVAALRGWRKQQLAERLEWGTAYQGAADDLLFTWQDGRPVPPDFVTKAFVKAQTGLDAPDSSSTSCGTRTRPCCCVTAFPFTWSPSGSATRTRP